jgi:hypothetical protein
MSAKNSSILADRARDAELRVTRNVDSAPYPACGGGGCVRSDVIAARNAGQRLAYPQTYL